MNIGLVGCGNISDVYIRNCRRFEMLKVAACADIDEVRAAAKARDFDLPCWCAVDDLLARPDIDTVLNLTPPSVHFEVAVRALEAGKHVYNEKPLSLTSVQGRGLLEKATAKGLRIGCAPDTFMGAGIQTARKILDAGELGRPVAATAFMLCRGHELWHPSPGFFYAAGGGPLFDMGPYYLTALVTLLGPARAVSAAAQSAFEQREIESEPQKGERITVETPTHISASVEFDAGVLCTLIMSFDVWHHHLPPLEVHCVDGSMSLPDPNTFGGTVRVRSGRAKSWRKVNCTHGYEDNARGVGLADMANAMRSGRPHRASGEMAFHVLDVMESVLTAAASGRRIELNSRCERPERMPQGLEFGQIDA